MATGNQPTKEQVMAALKQVLDPELQLSIVDLGLVYDVDILDDGSVTVTMTLTTPGCPLNAYLPAQVDRAVSRLEGVKHVDVNLVWDPPWNPDMMSEEAKTALGWFR
ncbi:MAG TPA: metal-sulfur cluster assembly factor [Firmicutes bacterium]|nr:metal-sulfur cluster assembly factor [Bacillota bacterium]